MIVTRSKREEFIKKFEVKCKSLILEPCKDNLQRTKIIIDKVHIFYVDTYRIKSFLK